MKVDEHHFSVFPEFKQASYARRSEILLTKLLRERLYDGTCLLLTSQEKGVNGGHHSPTKELCFRSFAAGLTAHAIAYAKMHQQPKKRRKK